MDRITGGRFVLGARCGGDPIREVERAYCLDGTDPAWRDAVVTEAPLLDRSGGPGDLGSAQDAGLTRLARLYHKQEDLAAAEEAYREFLRNPGSDEALRLRAQEGLLQIAKTRNPVLLDLSAERPASPQPGRVLLRDKYHLSDRVSRWLRPSSA